NKDEEQVVLASLSQKQSAKFYENTLKIVDNSNPSYLSNTKFEEYADLLSRHDPKGKIWIPSELKDRMFENAETISIEDASITGKINQNESLTLPSVTPKQLATVPIEVSDFKLSNYQRRELLFEMHISLQKYKIVYIDEESNTLFISHLISNSVKLFSISDVSFDSNHNDPKPFDGEKLSPSRSN